MVIMTNNNFLHFISFLEICHFSNKNIKQNNDVIYLILTKFWITRLWPLTEPFVINRSLFTA